MAVHYFHCTDGVDLIVDRRGRDAKGPADIIVGARTVADEVMRAVPAYDEWQNWSVHVYDERGEIEIVPFRSGYARAGLAERRAA